MQTVINNLKKSISLLKITIVLITYNSFNYVFKRLESIKKRTYSNTELVISDYCSTINTINICEKWIVNNAQFFTNFKLIKSETNICIIEGINNNILFVKKRAREYNNMTNFINMIYFNFG